MHVFQIIFFIVNLLFSNELYSIASVDNVETKSMQLPHPPLLARREGTPISIYPHTWSCTLIWMYTELSSCLSVCISVCSSYICARVHVRGRTHPPHLSIYCNRTSLPSFAIGCYGNKGTDWSGCSSQSETQREKTEREGKMFACRPNNDNRFNTTYQKTQFIYSGKQNDKATERWV